MEKENKIVFIFLSVLILTVILLTLTIRNSITEEHPIIETNNNLTIIDFSLPLYSKDGTKTGNIDASAVTLIDENRMCFYNMRLVNNGKTLYSSVSIYNMNKCELCVLSDLKTTDSNFTMTAKSGIIDLNTMEMKNLKGTKIYQHGQKTKANL